MVDINNLGNNNSLFGFGNVEDELEQEEDKAGREKRERGKETSRAPQEYFFL